MNEKIEKALGEELLEQVRAALAGKGEKGKDIELAVLNDGSVVPTEKYETLKSQLEAAKTAADAATEQATQALLAVGGTGLPENLQADAEKAAKRLEELQQNHEAEIAQIKKTFAVTAALQGLAHDPQDLLGMIDLEVVELTEAGALATDLTALVEEVRQRKPYLFLQETQNNTQRVVTGPVPADTPGSYEKNDPDRWHTPFTGHNLNPIFK